ncbi:uncharacterized protein LOC114472959 [Gouania willdenowi]|uniref:uncharacterized protein LOC114472959 n=1 Tax=Gouania willdenowi TaxID=441366 RepID=UPI0010567365|nr:uncharacterized protein LOC114472959 [Gouania willdenowi]
MKGSTIGRILRRRTVCQPESLRGRPIVLLHGFSELLPDPSFCLCDCAGCSTLGLPVPLSCLRSPTSQKGQVGLLLQLDGIPYFRTPPPGSGIAAATGTRDFTATAANGCIDDGGGEHGPLGLHVSHLPRDLVEAHLEVGVKDPTDRGIHQTFPTDPHHTFVPARRRDVTLSFTGVNSNTWRLSWGAKGKPTPARRLFSRATPEKWSVQPLSRSWDPEPNYI